jgi:hypothetical protein
VRRAVFATVLVALAVSAPADAAVVKVDCTKNQNLQAKLSSAPAGSTILIKGTCVGAFVIPKKLTLKGNPKATLDANGTGPVLNIQIAKPIRLENLRIVDGSNLSGGGITAPGGDPLTLVNVTVAYNRAVFTGGGISSNGAVILRRSRVTGNVVEMHADGAVVRGGGIYATSVVLVDSSVSGNRAHATSDAGLTGGYGGGIHVIRGVTATRSHIDRNIARADGVQANGLGGGIAQQMEAPIRLTSSTVSKNDAIGSSLVTTGFARGAGVYGFAVIAKHTVFLGNRATAFSQSQAATATGGAMYLFGHASLTGVRIRNSVVDAKGGLTTQARGGGISASSVSERTTVTGSTLSDNAASAVSSGGTAHAAGGAMDIEGPNSTVRSTLSKNSAKANSATSSADAEGGAIGSDGQINMQSSTLSGNLARSTAANAGSFAFGGAIAAEDVTELSTVTNSTLTGNAARAFAAVSGGSAVANSGGGAVSILGAPLRFTNTTIARNTAASQGALISSHGGGIVANISPFELRGTLLAANEAPDGLECSGPITSLGWNLIGTTSGCTGLTTLSSDKTNKPAKLGKFGAFGGPTRTIRLLNGSLALNAIPKAACKVKHDQRGVKRPKEKRCEIGAWERSPS